LLDFCSPLGSLGLLHGADELREIGAVVPKISQALSESARRHLVLSEYSVGQFTDGDSKHPLSNLCVPHVNNDCRVIDQLAVQSYSSSTIKHEQSAVSSTGFCLVIEHDLKIGLKRFVLAGFLLEHCVQSTAVDLVAKFPGLSLTSGSQRAYEIFNRVFVAYLYTWLDGCANRYSAGVDRRAQ
jgi:nicotinamidase-related amidase